MCNPVVLQAYIHRQDTNYVHRRSMQGKAVGSMKTSATSTYFLIRNSEDGLPCSVHANVQPTYMYTF